MALRDRLTKPVATAIPAIPAILEPTRTPEPARIATIATIAAPQADAGARFWKLRTIEGGKAWDVHTVPEVTLSEARQLWPKAESVEGLA